MLSLTALICRTYAICHRDTLLCGFAKNYLHCTVVTQKVSPNLPTEFCGYMFALYVAVNQSIPGTNTCDRRTLYPHHKLTLTSASSWFNRRLINIWIFTRWIESHYKQAMRGEMANNEVINAGKYLQLVVTPFLAILSHSSNVLGHWTALRSDCSPFSR